MSIVVEDFVFFSRLVRKPKKKGNYIKTELSIASQNHTHHRFLIFFLPPFQFGWLINGARGNCQNNQVEQTLFHDIRGNNFVGGFFCASTFSLIFFSCVFIFHTCWGGSSVFSSSICLRWSFFSSSVNY